MFVFYLCLPHIIVLHYVIGIISQLISTKEESSKGTHAVTVDSAEIYEDGLVAGMSIQIPMELVEMFSDSDGDGDGGVVRAVSHLYTNVGGLFTTENLEENE